MQFWLYTLKNANEEALMGLVEPHDEPVLEFLTDITVALSQPDNSSFTLKYGGFLYFSNPCCESARLMPEFLCTVHTLKIPQERCIKKFSLVQARFYLLFKAIVKDPVRKLQPWM